MLIKAVVVLLAGYVIWRIGVAVALRREIRAAHRAGFPVTRADFDALFEGMPDGTSEGKQFLAVLSRLYDTPEGFRHLPPDDLKELREAACLLRNSEERIAASFSCDSMALRDECYDQFSEVYLRIFPCPYVEPDCDLTAEQMEVAERAWQRAEEAHERYEAALTRLGSRRISEKDRQKLLHWLEIELQARYECKNHLWRGDPLAEHNKLREDAPRLAELPLALQQPLPTQLRLLSKETRSEVQTYFAEHAEAVKTLHRLSSIRTWHFRRDYGKWPEDATCYYPRVM